ncbi:MAG: LytTR family DNA-binding domain-containing protein [bacterium]|nr:LytTR family DNA-binding domain-containing protein [bacterium]MCM1375454.1 LytTR family DNA-binding domain-containing protein [Muribaculum sp.]
MKIAICDDYRKDAERLKSFLLGHNVRTYTDGGKLLGDLEKYQVHYDLYLLDIFLEDSLDGLELARRIRAQDSEAVICFVSTSDAFYRDAYDLYAVQYLIKPVQEDEVRQLMERLVRRTERERSQCLVYKWRGQAGSIPYGRILFIDSKEHTLFIHCSDGSVQECKGKMDDLELQICGEVFCRCHQSFIANMYHVDRLNGNMLILGEHGVPISRRYYAKVKNRYQEILFEEVD